MLKSCTQRFSNWNNMWFLSDVFITPWSMIKIYVNRKEISIKQIKIEWENLVKTEQLYWINCCKHCYCEKLSYRSIVWPQHKFKRFGRILKLSMFCTHTHTHTNTYTCKSIFVFCFYLIIFMSSFSVWVLIQQSILTLEILLWCLQQCRRTDFVLWAL